MLPLLLSGRAGSGKTRRCLAEIADSLRASAEGPPLLLVAPRQATYQLERQILSEPGIDGFTRLRIVSFQRLAHFVFELTGREAPRMLNEEGRVMALRAILRQLQPRLRVYGECARWDGLARELSDLWREMVEHRVDSARLRTSAERVENPRLRAKLEDFAEIFDAYRDWLKAQGLRDGDELLDLAAEAVETGSLPEIDGLWLDGFAQMTPQERRLLLAVLPKCARATLAFCVPDRDAETEDQFSSLSLVARTYGQLREEIRARWKVEPVEETIEAPIGCGRFSDSPTLAHLEAHWPRPVAWSGELGSELRVVRCPTLEAEAVFAAREIRKFAREGGRYRDVAVLLRSLDSTHDTIKRVFRRYGIPCFLDRRESVAHHPLADLTRGILRSLVFDFEHRDFFGALKSGLFPVEQEQIDWLENLALARGWRGAIWNELTFDRRVSESDRRTANELRDEIFKPVRRLQRKLGANPTGKEMFEALRRFWDDLGVEAKLSKWDEASHSSVWTQMGQWLETIDLAFGNATIPLGDWLEILEAGLASLTVGLIPPSLDQVLVGAIDRSRNPDLRAVFLLGLNEGVFPAPGKERLLLSDAERDELALAGCKVADPTIWNLGRESFYGYIACTRARATVAITFAQAGADGSPLNPSVFVSRLQRLFPKLEPVDFEPPQWWEAEAPHELNSLIFRTAQNGGGDGMGARMMQWPVFTEARERARLGVVAEQEELSVETVARLYGNRLRTSVSRLEEFAACAFRFFVTSGLRARERLEFQLDAREKGAFTHAILAEFHRRVEASGRKWREIPAREGRGLIREIANELEGSFQDGLARATPTNRFQARAKAAAVEEFIAAYLGLLRGCEFDPAHVELPFGFGDAEPGLPVWRVPIDESGAALEFSGRIDRVDVFIDQKNGRCLALALDYKSSDKRLERALVENAIQQQLPAYLAALKNVAGEPFFPMPVKPVGAFYVNLRPKVSFAKTREEAWAESKAEPDLAQQGVFSDEILDRLDPGGSRALFHYPIRPNDASFSKLPAGEFDELVAKTEERLRELGRRIFGGEVAMNPYLHRRKRACDQCPHGAVCRIDPWTHQFRTLA